MLKDVGLSKLAYKINVNRHGQEHQAGSDALLTLSTYYQLIQSYMKQDLQILDKMSNVIYGIGKGYILNKDYHRNKTWDNENLDYDQSFMYQNYMQSFDHPFYQQQQQQENYYNFN